MTEGVTIVNNPLVVTINDGSPTQVTIVDANSGTITITDGTPQVTVKTNQPTEVIVHSGIGGKYDFNTVAGMLFGKVTSDFLNPTLNEDISNIRSLWNRIGAEVVLLLADGDAISAASQSYTDGKFTQALLEAAVDADSKLDLRASSIEQDVNSITNTVLAVTGPAGALETLQSQITQTAEDIVSTVLRIDAIDDPVTGVLAAHQSSIDQNAEDITLRLLTTDLATNQVIADIGSSMSAVEGNISDWVTRMDSMDGSLTSAVAELTSTTAKTEIVEGNLDIHEWRLTATETMLSTKWGVTIAETSGGDKYVTGVGIVLHPDWTLDHNYVTNDYVFFFDGLVGGVFIALQDHLSSSSNSPISGLDTYWATSTGSKSSLTIQAAELKVITPDEVIKPLLTLDGDALILGSDIALRSSNYGHETEPWYNIDPATGQAELRNIVMSFSGSGRTDLQTVLNVADGADVTANSEFAISTAATLEFIQSQLDGVVESYFYDYDPTLSNVPYTDWVTPDTRDNHLGDTFYNSTSGDAFRFQKVGSVYSWLLLAESGVAAAMAAAVAAQDTADHKRRVFVATPTVPYDVGDLWADGSIIKRCTVARTSSQSYTAGDWSTTSTVGAPSGTYVGSVLSQSVAGWGHASDTTKIDGGKIYTDSVTADKINVTTLSAIVANTGALTATGAVTVGTSGKIQSGKTTYGAGTGFIIEYNGGTPRFDIGNPTDYMRWNGSVLSIGGDIVGTDNVQVNSITNPVSAFTSASMTLNGSYQNVQTLTITTSGGKVDIHANFYLGASHTGSPDFSNTTSTIKLYRGTTELNSGGSVSSNYPVNGTLLGSLMYSETLAAGTYTYYLKATGSNGSVSNRYLSAVELLR